MDSYFFYTCTGFVALTETGAATDSASVSVYAASEREALTKAKRMVQKPQWRVASVLEHRPDLEHPEIYAPQLGWIEGHLNGAPKPLALGEGN